ncbi:sensor histidine kinase [Sulfurovum sp.]|uniref:sensor histidine kinase n=1 Tax=Sulfurovum sp. TaxID=1969726 RepID=UPI0025F1D96D|nr:sensor histidine kinase [Sulfurovum sp.]
MNFEDDILKGRYFPLKDRNRLKATMITLMVLLATLLFALDLYESFGKGYETMTMVEISMIIILSALYLLFPHIISLNLMITITLLVITLFLLFSLGIPDINPEFSLFWIAALPLPFFYFLGADKGMKWSLLLFTTLLLLAFAVRMEWVTLLYNSGLILQMAIGYIIIAYWLFLIEKERSVNANNLTTALAGQEVLFKEVHHRTKNNMQVMMGLLETQSFKIDDPHYKKMFQAHVERIKAMSLVHENLYKNERYEKVDMHKYLGELADNLQKFTSHTIITEIDFVYLDMKTSMNLGLIFNEAVSNAIEHAYSVGSGYIDASLTCIEQQCILRIKDYGRGFNLDKAYHTLGMTLIEDLSASLPNGSMEIKVSEGTEVKVYFNTQEERS